MNDLLDSAPCGFMSFADDGTITVINATLLHMLGYQRDELLGRKVEALLPAGGRMFYRAYFEPRLKLQGQLEEIYMVFQTKAGAELPVLANAVRRERDQSFVSDCVLVSMRQRSQYETELVEARRQAESATLAAARANRDLEAFSYSVSHDLRAPLRAIDGFSRILQEEYGANLPEEVQRYLNLVRGNAQQMGRLIDDLLTFSRLSRQPLNTRSVEPGQLARQCWEELRAEQPERQVEITIGELPACQADPALLKQVWVNLLSNALKYTRRRDPATVAIGSRVEGDRVIYFIQDNGVGFDMRYSDKLFSVFQRMHRAEEYEGTGVGLAIVQRIIHRHGGRVWADAAIDRGASFYFTLGETSHD